VSTNEILLTALDFPLNVYAWSLHLAGQPVEYLHYGLWESGDQEQDIYRCQARASEYLFSRLPQPPAHLLEVGIGLGASARRLVAQGYQYNGVTPDNTQILYTRHTHRKSPIEVERGYFQRYTHPSWVDVILFQESAQYIPPSEIFRQCKRLLKPGGDIILMDEIPTGLMVNLVHSVGAWGFDLIAHEELTAQATPSIPHLIAIIQRHYDLLQYELNVTAQRLDQLLRSLDKRRQAYMSGEYTYQFIHLRKQP